MQAIVCSTAPSKHIGALKYAIHNALWLLLFSCPFGSPATVDDIADRWLEMEARLGKLEKSMEALSAKPHLELHDNPFKPLEQQSSTVSSRFVVARPKPTWSSVMNFEVAVRPDAAVTAMHVPASPPEYGHPKHFLIGDERGRIHVLGMDGSIQGQYQIHESSPVTALSELRISKNTSYVLSGHSDGCVLWSRLSSNTVYTRNETQLGQGTYTSSKALTMTTIRNSSYCPPCEAPGETSQSIKLVDIGRMLPKQRRIVGVAVTRGNELLMLRDRLRIPVRTMVNADVLHVYHENKQVRMLTDKGFSHVTLYTGDGTARAMTCKGLNGTRLVAAMPDFLTRARSFAMSAEGELVGLLLLGEKRITSCRVRFKKKVASPKGPVTMGIAADAIVVRHDDGTAILNATGAAHWRSRHVLNIGTDLLMRDLGIREGEPTEEVVSLQASKGRFLLLLLRNNVVALYLRHGSNAGTFGGIGTDWLRWARPIILVCMFGFAAYKFLSAKANAGSTGGRYGLPARSRGLNSRYSGHGGAFAGHMSHAQQNMYQSRFASRGENCLDSMAGVY